MGSAEITTWEKSKNDTTENICKKMKSELIMIK